MLLWQYIVCLHPLALAFFHPGRHKSFNLDQCSVQAQTQKFFCCCKKEGDEMMWPHWTAFGITVLQWSIMYVTNKDGWKTRVLSRIIFVVQLFPLNFLTVLLLSLEFLEEFAAPGFPSLSSWLFVSTRELQCFNFQCFSKMFLTCD